ncbi:SseB family protein [Butyrivibrio sp. FCS006]|uniref:SseB family protein n=1 Tax=Butyrivibrio sp. FCS006 TaxID=1280684 RepID=UPI0004069689|nr:SseB family protein [Butyrivibrio sp. FCS006]
MGIFSIFGNKKNGEASEQEAEQAQSLKKANAKEEAIKAHEGLEWPVIGRINPINTKDSEGERADETVSSEKKDEIGAMIYEEEIDPEYVKGLSGQELLFLLTALEVFNKKAALPGFEKNHRLVYNEVLRRVRDAEYLFVLYDQSTGYPFIEQGFANVYFEQELAEKAAEIFNKQFRKVAARKCQIEDPNYKGGGKFGFFDYLYYIGIENLLVDNGGYRARFKRNEIVAAPGEWSGAERRPEPVNSALNFAMIDFLEEVRWPVKYEKRDDILKAKEMRMLSLIRGAQLLVPTQHEGPTEVDENGRIKIGKDTKLKFMVVKTKDDKQFLPVYTDPFEFAKQGVTKDWNAGVFRYQDVIRFIQDREGLVINPLGQSVVLTKDRIMALEVAGKQAEMMRAKNQAGQVAAASTTDAVSAAVSQAMAEMRKEDNQ